MWKPAERILYQAQPGRWPSADEAAHARLFQPLDAGRLHLASRTWVPAMVPWRATEQGDATDDVIAWYRRFAEGRPGAIVVEATGVRDIPSGPLLRIGDDRFIPGLARIVDAVRAASGRETRLFIQLIDFLAIRRRPDPATFFARYLQISDRLRAALGAENWPEARLRAHLSTLPEDALARVLSARELEALRFGYRERVTDLDRPHIAELPRVLPGLFAAAARRAEHAGFDGVELHCAHAYTLASFLSATNTRSDGYGGSREARLRLPLEVTVAVRAATGKDFVVGCRYLADECIAGGSGIDDACAFGVAFARAGMDFLSLSRGGKFDDAKQPAVGWAAYPYTGRSGYECMPARHSDAFGPFGRNVEATAAVRAAVRAAGYTTPVVVAGGMHGFEQAEALLREDKADIIGFARQSLADPDWFEKVRSGHGDAVRVCRYTNYCEGLDQKHKQVTCELWDREALEAPDAALTADGKRRLLAPRWVRDSH
jgi:2,4-dienoyl-CoA reductase-like NADH-dependent reductase (Old Yellow Enzyme family)